ncbi:MAG: helix-turn-helix domain-containing protein [Verrucomicrobia bacterium]|nr:helix-turn-helix domain-containing protein [Verrucomicrobiota bacterium]
MVIRFKLKQQIADLEYREKRRVTLQEIADETGLGRMTLSRMLNHPGTVVRTDVLDKLCKYFGCQVGDLAEHIEEDT